MWSIYMSLLCRIVDRDLCDLFDLIFQMIVLSQFEEGLLVFKANLQEMMCFQGCHQTGKHQVHDLRIEKVLKTEESLRVLFRF